MRLAPFPEGSACSTSPSRRSHPPVAVGRSPSPVPSRYRAPVRTAAAPPPPPTARPQTTAIARRHRAARHAADAAFAPVVKAARDPFARAAARRIHSTHSPAPSPTSSSPAAQPATLIALPADWVAAKRLGYRAEMELLRRAADSESLNLFKAHPDLEPNEYLVYEMSSREILGVQVKSVSFRPGTDEAHCSVYRPALRPSPHTWFVIFLAEAGSSQFLPNCAVIPSTEIARCLTGHGVDGQIAITRHLTGQLQRWRVPVATIGQRLAEVAAAGDSVG